MQGRSLVVGSHKRIGAARDQCPNRIHIPARSGKKQWGRAFKADTRVVVARGILRGPGIWIRAVTEKGLHQIHAFLIQCRIVQCCAASVISQIRIGAMVQKKSGKLGVAARGRNDERGHAIALPYFVNVGSGFK